MADTVTPPQRWLQIKISILVTPSYICTESRDV